MDKHRKKVLFVATVVKTHINAFHLPYLKMLKKMGYSTYVAAGNDFVNEPCEIPYCDVYFDIPFERSPFKIGNIKAYFKLKEVIERENFDIIHCHTPVGGILCRLAARRSRKKGTKVIYTAHGFHFYKGAPLKNWLLYYPAEKLCSYMTDVLITINKEDYALAKRRMSAKKTVYVPGVGVDLSRFAVQEKGKKEKLRKSFGCNSGDILLFSVGELNQNKNHSFVINTLGKLARHKQYQNIHYAIAGKGDLKTELKNLADKEGLADKVHFLGYINNICDWYQAADIFVFPSKREGLSLSLMEAMASGLPVICSRIRGNVDLITEYKGGFFFDPNNENELKAALQKILKADTAKMGEYNKRKICCFDLENTCMHMKKIYERMS